MKRLPSRWIIERLGFAIIAIASIAVMIFLTTLDQAAGMHWVLTTETPVEWSRRTGLPPRCCGVTDCAIKKVWLVNHGRAEADVIVDGVTMTLPSKDVFPSADGKGRWCAKDPNGPVSAENTRCVGLPPRPIASADHSANRLTPVRETKAYTERW